MTKFLHGNGYYSEKKDYLCACNHTLKQIITMAKIGYMLLAPKYDGAETDRKWMEDFGCEEIVAEEMPANERSRTLWDSLTARLQFGDILVIPKLSNALRGARQLIFFLEFCRVRNIRLVSIHDRIDSGNELFPDCRTSDVLTAIALLPKEANALRKQDHHVRKLHKEIKRISGKAAGRLERNRHVVNMYLQGYSIDDIHAQSGFRSRSSVFRILNDNGVDLNRGHTRGPIKKRKKDE